MNELCRDPLDVCECVLPAGHDGNIHECDCGGSWQSRPDGRRLPLTLPEEEGFYPEGRTVGLAKRAVADTALRKIARLALDSDNIDLTPEERAYLQTLVA